MWQPIETAPMTSYENRVFFVAWNGVEVVPATRDERGYVLDITNPDRDGEWLDVYPAATHWMPLPDPPA